MSQRHWVSSILCATMLAGAMTDNAVPQDMIRFLDLSSDEFTKADMTRAEIEAALAEAGASGRVDLSARRLNGLDLSALDFGAPGSRRRVLIVLKLTGANLDGVTLDQAWALDADLTGASLRGASLFATQLMGARLDSADLSGARIAADSCAPCPARAG